MYWSAGTFDLLLYWCIAMGIFICRKRGSDIEINMFCFLSLLSFLCLFYPGIYYFCFLPSLIGEETCCYTMQKRINNITRHHSTPNCPFSIIPEPERLAFRALVLPNVNKTCFNLWSCVLHFFSKSTFLSFGPLAWLCGPFLDLA